MGAASSHAGAEGAQRQVANGPEEVKVLLQLLLHRGSQRLQLPKGSLNPRLQALNPEPETLNPSPKP